MWEIVVATTIALAPLDKMPNIPTAPSDEIVNCSKPAYRQTHLAMCNNLDSPARGGGGNPGRGGRGLLGGLLGGIL